MFAKDNAHGIHLLHANCRESIHSGVNMRFLSYRIMRDDIKGSVSFFDDMRLWFNSHNRTPSVFVICLSPPKESIIGNSLFAPIKESRLAQSHVQHYDAPVNFKALRSR